MTANSELPNSTVIRNCQLFSGLPDPVIEKISSLATRRRAPKGTLLFSQFDSGSAFFGITYGRVRISSTSAEGDEVHIIELTAGDTFGEVALLDGGQRTASATVTEDSGLFQIERANFLALLDREPRLTRRVLERLCERVRWTSEIVEDLSMLSVSAQIGKRICLLAKQFGIDTPDGQTLHLSQIDLATFLGLSRQAVNTHLQAWQKEGWLTLSRGSIVIHDAVSLRNLN